ncbi:hypothetical protein M405DRAFT_821021 [Rhizopogon salebrosus TDB-379]|nr:hypothetical protein M405DRAFT_821021 [Rhizopogon salebrosus TDB-379]
MSRGVSTLPRSTFKGNRSLSPFDPRTMCAMPSDALNKGKQYNRECRDFMSNYSCRLVFLSSDVPIKTVRVVNTSR